MSSDLGFKNSSDYLKQCHKFKLGILPTEKSHPDTWNLSDLSKNDLLQAVDILKKLDLNVFQVLAQKTGEVNKLSEKIKEVFNSGGRVFIFGCGATGRLSLLIESIWNSCYPEKKGQVVSFMSGGDIALVQSVEGFEDELSYGARHLNDLGFTEEDLLICSTEGGETPIVIGAAQEATKISKHKCYYLYCNPTEVLVKNIDRSREIITHNKIHPVELYCGCMGVAGSTRMQASTILQAFISMALFQDKKGNSATELKLFNNFYSKFDLSFLKQFIEKESAIYVNFERLTYFVDSKFALNTFTDTTERAPTFSMKPFEHPSDLSLPLSLCYICINGAKSSAEAWRQLLIRPPRPLDWSDSMHRVSASYLNSFDFSHGAIKKREELSSSKNSFLIKDGGDFILWNLNDLKFKIDLPKKIHPHWIQVLLKILLNTHSTLIMGRLRRYEHNLMTWVSPSNGKLIDRTARYVDYFLKAEGINKSYEEIVEAIFAIDLKKDRSMVLEIFHNIKREHELNSQCI